MQLFFAYTKLTSRSYRRTWIAIVAWAQLTVAQVALAEPESSPVANEAIPISPDEPPAPTNEQQPVQGTAAPVAPDAIAVRTEPPREQARGGLTLRMHGKAPSMGLFMRTKDAAVVRLCALDCTLKLPAGAYQLGANHKDTELAWARDSVSLQHDSDVSVRYVSVRARRIAGASLVVGGAVAGLSFVVLGVGLALGDAIVSLAGRDESETPAASKALFGTGFIVGAAALVGGIYLMTRGPVARFEVQPYTLPVVASGQAPPSYSALQAVVWSCAPPETAAAELTVDINGAGEVTDLAAPETWGRGAKRCLHSRAIGKRLSAYRAGSWTLAFER